jgi:hypothetical protein
MAGPVYAPDWLATGKGLVYTGQERVEFQSYVMSLDPDTLVAESEVKPPGPVAVLPTDVGTEEAKGPKDTGIYDGPKHAYERHLGLDLVQNAFAVDPALGAGGAGQVALSDVLGNETVQIYLANTAEQFGGNFWDGFEGGLTYVNQSRRLNWGMGIFRLNQVYDPDLDIVRREPRTGILGLAMYPFNKYTRVEGSVLIRHATDHLLRDGLPERRPGLALPLAGARQRVMERAGTE